MAKPATLITGASGGIGLALAEIYAKNSHPLILVARSEDTLTEIAARLQKRYDIPVKPIALDLSAPGATAELYSQLAADQTPIDQLINNAGFANYGTFHSIPTDRQLDLIDLNIRVLTDLSQRFIPILLQFPNSRLVNVASTAAFFPGPHMAAYYASKAYVLSLSEALAEEYRTTHLAVCALCPGPTKTGFQDRAQMQRSRLMQGQFMTADQVAHAAYLGIQSGDPIIIPGTMNRFLTWLPRIMPRTALARIIAGAQEPV
ncbi:short-chain dehydrogenase [bacterium]|nr:short-chain dehydrogenase [bacterium]